jgi:hypothetical protein
VSDISEWFLGDCFSFLRKTALGFANAEKHAYRLKIFPDGKFCLDSQESLRTNQD